MFQFQTESPSYQLWFYLGLSPSRDQPGIDNIDEDQYNLKPVYDFHW